MLSVEEKRDGLILHTPCGGGLRVQKIGGIGSGGDGEAVCGVGALEVVVGVGGAESAWCVCGLVELVLLLLSLVHDLLLAFGGDLGVVGAGLEIDAVSAVGVGGSWIRSIRREGDAGEGSEGPIGVGDLLGLEDLALEGLDGEEKGGAGDGGEAAGAEGGQEAGGLFHGA